MGQSTVPHSKVKAPSLYITRGITAMIPMHVHATDLKTGLKQSLNSKYNI